MGTKHQSLRIGEVAMLAGVNVQTLRYYERRGLLREPVRRPSGYREYAPDDVRVIRFIKSAQGLGFSLKEVQELLRLREGKRAKCAEVKAAASAKIADIEAKVRSLRRALEVLVASCAGGDALQCPILDALDRRPQKGLEP